MGRKDQGRTLALVPNACGKGGAPAPCRCAAMGLLAPRPSQRHDAGPRLAVCD